MHKNREDKPDRCKEFEEHDVSLMYSPIFVGILKEQTDSFVNYIIELYRII